MGSESMVFLDWGPTVHTHRVYVVFAPFSPATVSLLNLGIQWAGHRMGMRW